MSRKRRYYQAPRIVIECRSQEGEDAYITAVTGRRPRHEEQEDE